MRAMANIHFDDNTIQHVEITAIETMFNYTMRVDYIKDGEDKELIINPDTTSLSIEFV